jgi:AcrR family transcriptional regulator
MATAADERETQRPEGGPRERLLAVASRLFYAEGVHVVGIDRILDEAGVAKASLYQHFGSRDGLVRAYLEENFAARRAHIEAVVASQPTPRLQLLALFDDIASRLSDKEFRGCRFVNASVEARGEEGALGVTKQYRSWLRSVLADLAGQAGAADSEMIGRQLAILYDGTAVAARFDADRAGAAAAFRAAAATLIDAAIEAGGAKPVTSPVS